MAMDRPIFWHQGLFLQPQHFQLLELSVQSLLTPIQQLIQPYFWGVGRLEIQRSALGRRIFSLVEGEFLFPDGTYAVFPGNAILEDRSFDDAWIEGGRPFAVYLGLRKWNKAGENVTALSGAGAISKVSTRFITSTDPEEVADLHEGGPTAEVKRLQFVLKILWESELEEVSDYNILPIAQLERLGEEIKLSENFSPPSLTCSDAETLVKIIKEVRDEVSARSHKLEEYKTQKGIHTAEFGARDMVYLLALRSLNRYVPLLFHFTQTQKIHPWLVYGVLRQLIGELSSFSERINVLGESDNGVALLPNYDHRNLWGCFSSAQSLITQLLDEITAGPEYILRLVYDGTYYSAEMLPAMFEGRNRYYLVLKTETDPKFVLQSLSTVAKLSNREHLPILIARALPGIRLEHLAVPPHELPRRAHSIYLQIDHHSDQWSFVEKSQNIGLYWDTAPDDLGVELMIVRR